MKDKIMNIETKSIWELYKSDVGNNGYFVSHIGYFDTKESAKLSKKDMFDEVRERKAIVLKKESSSEDIIYLLADDKPIDLHYNRI